MGRWIDCDSNCSKIQSLQTLQQQYPRCMFPERSDAVANCRQWQCSFQWKLRGHCLKGLLATAPDNMGLVIVELLHGTPNAVIHVFTLWSMENVGRWDKSLLLSIVLIADTQWYTVRLAKERKVGCRDYTDVTWALRLKACQINDCHRHRWKFDYLISLFWGA